MAYYRRRYRWQPPKSEAKTYIECIQTEGPCPEDVWARSSSIASGNPTADGNTTYVREYPTGGLYVMRATFSGGWTFDPIVGFEKIER